MNTVLGFGLVVLLLVFAAPLLQFAMLLYYKFKRENPAIIERADLPEEIWNLVAEGDAALTESGFSLLYVLYDTSNIVGKAHDMYRLYYFHAEEGVHAFLTTLLYEGAQRTHRVSFDTIYESKNICTTEDGIAHFIPCIPEEVTLYDHYLLDTAAAYQAHLQDRKSENETISKEAFDAEGLLAYESYVQERTIQTMVTHKLIGLIPEGYRYLFSMRTWRLAKNIYSGERRIRKILKGKRQKEDQDIPNQAYAITSQVKASEKVDTKGNIKMLFAVSVIAFVLLMGLVGFDAIDIVMLVVIILLHELGHFAAMRLFGYSNTKILFMPFGAVAMGTKDHRSAFQELVISLAGPVPGILLGAVLLLWTGLDNGEVLGGYVHSYAMLSLIINYINLLPIYPLDGGKVLQTLLMLRYPKAQFYFYLVSLALLVVAVIYFVDYILLIIVIALLFGLKQSWKMTKLLGSLGENDTSIESISKRLAADITYTKMTLTEKVKLAKQALLLKRTKKPGWGLILSGMVIYLLFLLPPIAMGSFAYYGMKKFENSFPTTEQDITIMDAYQMRMDHYKTLSDTKSDVALSMEKAMKRLDGYFAEYNLTQPSPLKKAPQNALFPCTLPEGLSQIYRWHDGINDLARAGALYSYEALLDTQKMLKEHGIKRSAKEISISDNLKILCGAKGIYMMNYSEVPMKRYYDFAHLLTLLADAYEEGVYIREGDRYRIDVIKLSSIRQKYLSAGDKKKYEEMIAFLKRKAQAYQKGKLSYMKRSVLLDMYNAGDARLIPMITLYIEDEDVQISALAKQLLRAEGWSPKPL